MTDRPITASEQDILNRLPQPLTPIAPPLRFKTCEWKPDSHEAFYDPGEFRWYRTEAGSKVTVRKSRGFSVEFDWAEESENGNACVECEVDPDATRDFNYQTLIWRCPHCGGGSAPLDPFTP